MFVLGGLAAAALVLALRMPLEVAVFAVLVFGLPHVALEVRYVYGRFGAGLPRWLVIGLQVVLGAVVLDRLLVTGRVARVTETLLLGTLLVAAVAVPAGTSTAGASTADPTGNPIARRRPRWIVAVAIAAVLAAVALALAGIDSWFLVQVHLHNIVPLAFLWEWCAAEVAPADRARARAAMVALFVAVPAAILLGVFDAWLGPVAGAFAGTGSAEATLKVGAGLVPAGVDRVWPARLLVAFAYAQLAHYAVWCWFLPRSRAGREAGASFSAGRRKVVGGRRYVVLALVATVAVALWALVDLRSGRGAYTSIAAYHALLEYPLLVLLARKVVRGPNLSGTCL